MVLDNFKRIYFCKLLIINEKQVYKKYIYFRENIQSDFKVFQPRIEAEKTSV